MHWVKTNGVAVAALLLSISITVGNNVYQSGKDDLRLTVVEKTLESRSGYIKEFEEYKTLLDKNVYYSKRHNTNINKLQEEVSALKTDQEVTNVILVELKDVVKDLSYVTGELKSLLGDRVTRLEEKVNHIQDKG